MSTKPIPVSEWKSRRTIVLSVAIGALYGLGLRLFAALVNSAPQFFHDGSANVIMTLSFLALGPFVVGFLSVYRAEKVSGPRSPSYWLFAPWFSVLLMMLAMMVLLLEGTICIVMAAPIALVVSSLGGVAGGLLGRRSQGSRSTAFSIACLPFLLAPAEALHLAPTQLRTVQSDILIHAPAPVVWGNIKRVPAIDPAELPTGWRATWAQHLGFPRPVEATLSFEGVGGVRDATFEHGLRFFETVTTWQPDRRLAFTIKADTANIPPTTLDEHVTIGGPYFDVLDGEYRLEALPGGNTLLHLTSHQRLSTDLNGYAGLWTDSVMQSLQTSILSVIRDRCETISSGTPATVAHIAHATP